MHCAVNNEGDEKGQEVEATYVNLGEQDDGQGWVRLCSGSYPPFTSERR